MVDEEFKETILHVHRTEHPAYQDSIEIGKTATGILKVYFNANDEETALKRLDVAYKLLVKSRELMGV